MGVDRNKISCHRGIGGEERRKKEKETVRKKREKRKVSLGIERHTEREGLESGNRLAEAVEIKESSRWSRSDPSRKEDRSK